MKQFFFLMVLVLLIAGCQDSSKAGSAAIPKESSVSFMTTDGWAIKGTLYSSPGHSILLLHGLGDHRAAWTEYARILQNEGYNVLAIDMRGHGESTKKGNETRTWQRFSVQDFKSMTKDIAAAQAYLEGENISIIGASIGANIALNYAAQGSKISALVLLSPGLNYQDVTTEDAMRLYKGPAYLAAGKLDGASADAVQRLDQIAAGPTEPKIYDTGNHGTALLEDEQVQNSITAWLRKNYAAARRVDNSTNISSATRRR
jgi:pimeloyl-ACP methyl ester carboxylesterase